MVTWVSFSDLEQYLKTPKSSLYKLRSAGRLVGHKVGRNYRFDRDHVDELVKHGALAKCSKEQHL